jgi:hypothetical protein
MTDIEHLAGLLRAAYAATGDKRFARALFELEPCARHVLEVERMGRLVRDNPGLPARSAAALVGGQDVDQLVCLFNHDRAS